MARLITFGGLSARNGDIINGVANPRSRLAILAVLAVAGERGIRREKLAAMFWPDSDEERSRNALRQALFTLKRDIGAGEITIGVSDLRLNPDVLTADVSDFDVAMREQRFSDAASLYRGTFLDGVYLKESPEFERWAEEQRAHLASEYGRALERAAVDSSQRADHRAAADWWEKRARHDPLSGRVARHYMEALVTAGDREQAIRHAAFHAQLVRQELEAEPDAELLALAERLRDTGGSVRPFDAAQNAERGDRAALGSPEERLHPSTLEDAARPRVRRLVNRGVLFAVPLIGLASALYLVRTSRSKTTAPRRSVAVTALDNQTTDSSLGMLGDVIRNEINRGLTESGLADVAESRSVDSMGIATRTSPRARMRSVGPRWRYLISGSYAVTGESLLVHIELWESSRETVFRTVSVSTPRNAETTAIARMVRSSVLAAIAPRLDPWLSNWSEAFTQPSRFDAYDRFAEALRQPIPDGREERQVKLFREAAGLDSNFHLAPLWLLFVDEQPEPMRDSIIQQLTRRRPRMTEFERALLDYHVAVKADRRRMFLSSRRLTALAPRSDWLLWVYANDAAMLGRPGDALAALQQIDTAGPWMMRIGGASYWTFTRSMHHAMGQHALALSAAKRAMGDRPDLGILRQRELAELAALGRLNDVDQLLNGIEDWSRSTLDGSTLAVPFALAVEEFAAHGHSAQAKRVSARLDSVIALLPDSVRRKPRMLNVRARVFIALDQPEKALEAIEARWSEMGWETLSLLALAAGAAGHRAAADSALDVLMAKSVHRQRVFARARAAQVYALLGDRQRAIASLRQALLEGAGWIPLVHDRPAADSLRRFPTAEALLRDARQSSTP